ncbi:GNAT family N-acetyltransferase [Phycicoccus sonneratiae]|uniref:GNAT family N-acetyltransferase n=1 Tax=Phycicoccus sonneratiae TaxID=2807628 RepID=A0ABS2CLC4_9MICO|nr:GNAT family protein [Phycicoccus sonneraticus]MBM6400664.1 GNAT family N-acetyltransferase [Phycicoccus sonneraticus]
MDAPSLTADPLTLRALRPEDRAARRRHGWHAEIERAYGSSTGTRAMTDDELERWSANWERGASEPNRIHWVLDVGGEAVGAAFLHGVDPVDRRARYAVGLYHPSWLGRGLGRRATRLVLGYAFGPLGLHRVDLRVLDDNHRARATYRACGFVEEGRERETCFLDGRWHDDVVMAVLEHEFDSSTAG